MSPIPANRQPLEILQERYSKALEHVFDAREVMANSELRPGRITENIFDFEDGLRLIVSRDMLSPDSKVYLHFSASFPADCPLEVKIRKDKINFAGFLEMVPDRFRELSGEKREIRYIGVFMGVPHWIIEE